MLPEQPISKELVSHWFNSELFAYGIDGCKNNNDNNNDRN